MMIRTYTAFADIPHDVRSQLSHPHEADFFRSLDWFELLFETSLKATHAPRIYVALAADGGVRCSLYCGVTTDSARTLVSLTNFYSLSYLPGFAQGERDPAALRELVQHIAAERPAWKALRLSTLIDEAPESGWLVEGLEASGFRTERFFQYENWYANVAGQTFEDYFAQRPSQLRNTVTRKQKKLEKTHRTEIRIARSDPAEAAAVVRDFIAVYESSWKQPEPFPDFIPTLAARCAALGILRLGALYVDGQAAAAQLWITAGRRTIIYKLAYDEKFGPLGVGSILSRELFRVAIDEDRVEEIDYGVGSDAYKKDWMTAVRHIRGIEAFNASTAAGFVLAAWARTKSAVKKWRGEAKPAGAPT
ncbi:GNAT family N-acetyltransferase [Piscinibacter sp. XHJ-5]|uniref:GNAT family N-acetyltransferase n=1 Tax=Piscinibacter sp. XHJ-5 TaxID=3037797 RepID=UPI0024535D8D|nr:GNAT family N-acetyltransferase [Piscinibacter sp. XHJ-5]